MQPSLVLAALTTIVLVTPAIEYVGVIPRIAPPPSARRWLLDMLCSLAGYGGWLAVTGSVPVATLMTPVLMIITVVASNIKHRVLGEPLLFSDLVVARSFLQHPKFYLFSIPATARIALVMLVAVPPVLLWIYASAALFPHLLGVGMLLGACLALWLCPAQSWASVPDVQRDLSRLGLPGSMLLYWRQWRASPDQPPPPPLQGKPPMTRSSSYNVNLSPTLQHWACLRAFKHLPCPAWRAHENWRCSRAPYMSAGSGPIPCVPNMACCSGRTKRHWASGIMIRS